MTDNESDKNIKGLKSSPLEAGGCLLIILGAGESGVGAALLAKQKGFNVFVSDAGIIKQEYKKELIEHGIDFEEQQHSEEKILNADMIIKSPGIPDKSEMIKNVSEKNIPVISEIEFAYQFKGDSKIIAVTGSNGKTTTTALTHHICKTAELDCAMVGNIGYSFARQVATEPKSLYVAEISSFQLDDIKDFRPDISVLLNITEDHLDRYNYKFENYINSKFRIIENQQPGDYFIYNADDKVIANKLKNIVLKTNPLPFSMKQEPGQGAYITHNSMMLEFQGERISMSIYDFAVKGMHNRYNTMAAGLAALLIGIRKEKIREAITTFQSLEHRMEHVATVRGIDFINDSKATNVNSTWYALESMEKPTILILGGIDKGNDYTLIEELVKEKVKAIICMGIDNKKIHEAFEKIIPVMADTISAQQAVELAFRLSNKGDVVLLSPACASFDLFKNYEDRGRQFKQAVKDL
ncbi:MAG: UDP-N-acetylmuramoyl-L-alanine--D-glutamate ligase [Parafilimonas sp.]